MVTIREKQRAHCEWPPAPSPKLSLCAEMRGQERQDATLTPVPPRGNHMSPFHTLAAGGVNATLAWHVPPIANAWLLP